MANEKSEANSGRKTRVTLEQLKKMKGATNIAQVLAEQRSEGVKERKK